jgi:hypothetical protein
MNKMYTCMEGHYFDWQSESHRGFYPNKLHGLKVIGAFTLTGLCFFFNS